MKYLIQKTAVLCAITLGLTVGVYADVEGAIGAVSDVVGEILETPFDAGVDGVNDGLRTFKDTTTVKGKVDIQVDAQSITQTISGGENNINELNLGSVGGGAFVDGSFTTDVTVGEIRQTISGSNNRNRANIGSVSD